MARPEDNGVNGYQVRSSCFVTSIRLSVGAKEHMEALIEEIHSHNHSRLRRRIVENIKDGLYTKNKQKLIEDLEEAGLSCLADKLREDHSRIWG